MPVFIVEDGTGLPDATAYIDVAFADDYLGNTAWAPDTNAKQNAIMQGTEYIDMRFGASFLGFPLTEDQALEFPRERLYDRYGNAVEGVPLDLMKACALYAQEAHNGTLEPSPPSDTAKEIKKKKVVVGPITTETEYQGIVRASSWLSFPKADRFVTQYTSRVRGGRVIR